MAFPAVSYRVYVLFLITFVDLAGFVRESWVPKSIDAAGRTTTSVALAIDLLLLLLLLLVLFAAQHSIMARTTFKKGWTRVVPQSIERCPVPCNPSKESGRHG